MNRRIASGVVMASISWDTRTARQNLSGAGVIRRRVIDARALCIVRNRSARVHDIFAVAWSVDSPSTMPSIDADIHDDASREYATAASHSHPSAATPSSARWPASSGHIASGPRQRPSCTRPHEQETAADGPVCGRGRQARSARGSAPALPDRAAPGTRMG
jgi:hypothetical protein